MKFFFISSFIFLIFFSCNSQDTLTVSSSEIKGEIFTKNNAELIRTFENDYSFWKSKNNKEIYEDLSSNLGFFNSFQELRKAQYRSMGIVTDLSEIQSLIDSGSPTFLEGWSETCVYCKLSEVVLNSLKDEYKNDINFVVVDVANRYLDDVTPTLKKY